MASSKEKPAAQGCNARFLGLPNELMHCISNLLSNSDIKSLRLASRRLKSSFRLRFDRVFISPSRRNIEVFRAVANHPEFRSHVREIVWDDARFYNCRAMDDETDSWEFETTHLGSVNPRFFQSFWASFGNGSFWNEENTQDERIATVEENLAFYHHLYEEQEQVIEAKEDIDTFRYGLTAFPSLQRVTITSEVYHETVSKEQYSRFPTPLTRSFPPTFKFPYPWPWLGEDFDRNEFTWDMMWSDVRKNWRGFSIILEELADCPRPILEFVVDVEGQPTGIGHQFLLEPSTEYENFKSICRRGLRHLDLALNIGSEKQCGLPTVNDGNLTLALLMATQLEHFSLHTTARTADASFVVVDDFDDASCLSVSTLPVAEWKSLRYLSLSHLPILLEDLLSLLGLLPPSTQTMKLIQIEIVDSTWEEALQRLKEDLRWSRDHPRIAIAQETMSEPNKKIWIEEEILLFLEGGHNPFVGGQSADSIHWGFGTIKDDYDDRVNEPYEPDRKIHVQVSPGVWQTKRLDELDDDVRPYMLR